ncbi:unnamed protein product [Pylaiella littoralis]
MTISIAPIVGEEILFKNTYKGRVAFAGDVHFASGEHVGIELEDAVGDCNGTVEGKTYFNCEPKYGVLTPLENVTYPEETGGKASQPSAQSVSRKIMARRKAAKERNSKVWNKLDNMNEQLAIKRSMQLMSLFGTTSSKDLLNDAEPDIEDGSDDVEGPTLEFPITEPQIMKMMEAFKEGHTLNIRYAWPLIKQAKDIFSKESTVQECAVATEGKMTVVGDIHGQLQDLFSIFTINGIPCPQNHYIFNGDFVDRGPCGAEVLFTLCAFKVMQPDCIRLNRGNHESRQQNKIMGFEEEIFQKYAGRNGRLLLRACHLLFDVLPLCALIQERIFVVHGGLFPHDGVTLGHIRGMSRKREPPIHGNSFEDQIFEAMLWSDPRPIQGRQISARGAGVEFGQDVTHEFLRTNRAALIIRSHECVREGFELLHSGRLITLFSASRYCGMQTNKGAFLTIGPELQPEIQQFYAHSVSETCFDQDAMQKETEERLETEAVSMIIERLLDLKPSLYWHYTRQDQTKSGRVSKVQWANGLNLVLQLDVPFLSYVERLAEVEEDDSINYTKFLERYRVQVTGLNSGQWQDAIVDQICERIFVAMGAGDVQSAFNYFDVDGDGTIEYEEFVNALKALEIGLSDDQVFELMRGLDKDCDSTIDIQEFASRFAPVFSRLNMKQDEDISKAIAGRRCSLVLSPSQNEQMVHLITKLLKKYMTMEKAYVELDKEGVGYLTYDDLADKFIALGVTLSKGDLVSLAADIDTDNDKKISKAEFKRAFRVTDRRGSVGRQSVQIMDPEELQKQLQAQGEDRLERAQSASSASSAGGGEGGRLMQEVGWQEGVIQSVANFMFQNRRQLAGAFRSFDLDGDGCIDRNEFRFGMRKMNEVFSRPVTDDQIDAIMDALDTDGDGTLTYNEFLAGFTVMDTSKTVTPSSSSEPASSPPTP